MPLSTLPRFLLFRLPTLAAQLEEEQTMEIMYERVAGLDIHKATIVACVRLGAGRNVTRGCRTFGLRLDQAELRSGRGRAGTAFAAAHPQATGTRADAACPADPEDARRGQRQTGLGAVRHHGRQRAADNRGDDSGRTRSAPVGGVGQHPDQGDAEAVVRCAAWTADGSSPVPADASSAAMG